MIFSLLFRFCRDPRRQASMPIYLRGIIPEGMPMEPPPRIHRSIYNQTFLILQGTVLKTRQQCSFSCSRAYWPPPGEGTGECQKWQGLEQLWIFNTRNWRPLPEPAAFHQTWTSTPNPSREVYSGRAPPPPSNYMYICMYVYMYIFIYVYMYINIQVCMYICIS